MSSSIISERMTATMEGDFCVFLIGMRINRLWKVHKWLPMLAAMTRMLRELQAHEELGFLGNEAWFGRTIIVLQYWRSARDLIDYAAAKNHEHLPAWRAFTRKVGNSGDVGIYHETYLVRPGAYETIYHNMPPFGLGRVGKLVAATGHYHTAKDRISAEQKAGPIG